MAALTVLIAEDSDSTRKALRTVLGFHDYEIVAEVVDGEEAVEAYKKYEPDIVLMDIAMPKKHGIDAIKEICAFDPKARTIAITALYSPEKREAVLDAGAMALVSKPFDVPDLLHALERVRRDGIPDEAGET